METKKRIYEPLLVIGLMVIAMTLAMTQVFNSSAHTASQMNAAINVSSTCPAHGNCVEPDDCNGYQYNGRHYKSNIINGVQTIYYSIDSSVRFENIVREATDTWNSICMYGGTGQIIDLVEVNADQTTYNGYPVCRIKYVSPNPHDINPGVGEGGGSRSRIAGEFFSTTDSNRDITGCYIQIYPNGISLQTIMHELGHLLGLADLDDIENPNNRHSQLMGYGTKNGLTYQDIQGAALYNLAHTGHTFMRYIDKGAGAGAARYRFVCLYCDGYQDRSNNSGSQAMLSQNNCTHSYELIVSAGKQRWNKCTKCYHVKGEGIVNRHDDWALITDTDYNDPDLQNMLYSLTFKEVHTISIYNDWGEILDPMEMWGRIQDKMGEARALKFIFYGKTGVFHSAFNQDVYDRLRIFMASGEIMDYIIVGNDWIGRSSICGSIGGDSYGLAVKIATEYVNQFPGGIDRIRALYTQMGECDRQEGGYGRGYFPVIAPARYKNNSDFLMGLFHVFGFPVDIVSEPEEVEEALYKFNWFGLDLNNWLVVDISCSKRICKNCHADWLDINDPYCWQCRYWEYEYISGKIFCSSCNNEWLDINDQYCMYCYSSAYYCYDVLYPVISYGNGCFVFGKDEDYLLYLQNNFSNINAYSYMSKIALSDILLSLYVLCDTGIEPQGWEDWGFDWASHRDTYNYYMEYEIWFDFYQRGLIDPEYGMNREKYSAEWFLWFRDFCLHGDNFNEVEKGLDQASDYLRGLGFDGFDNRYSTLIFYWMMNRYYVHQYYNYINDWGSYWSWNSGMRVEQIIIDL